MMSRPCFRLALLLTLAGNANAAEAARPNILFVIADQWRAQAFGFAGDPNVRTPHLDRFERQCVNFIQAVAGMPVCSPTRASLLTGQRPQTHGVFLNDVPLSTNAVTSAKELKRAGYETGCIGKWHIDGHGNRSAFIPRDRRQGFDYWKVLECTHAYNNSPYYADGPEKLLWDGYDATAQTRDAQAYLRDRAKSGRPFLLWLAWGPPSCTFRCSRRATAKADPARLPGDERQRVERIQGRLVDLGNPTVADRIGGAGLERDEQPLGRP
jgi:arylsulfatase A-like enzyme